MKKILALSLGVLCLFSGSLFGVRNRDISKSLRYSKKCIKTCKMVEKEDCDCKRTCQSCKRACENYVKKIEGDKINTLGKFCKGGCLSFADDCIKKCEESRTIMKKCSKGEDRAHKKCMRACKKCVKRMKKIKKKCSK
ncbi:hypothetical protein ACFLYH_02135 [Candidatus Dependentiae bacterium]